MPTYHDLLKEEKAITDKQRQWDTSYLKMACILAENSYAIRRKVGCLIIKDRTIIADGVNGCPNGILNECEINDNGNLTTKEEVIHAEQNALIKCAKNGISCNRATIYVSDEPCINCAKLLIQAGIKRVVYAREYRLHDGINLLHKANIEVLQIKI